ncbi:rhomboid family intramembrane serine protease [Patulibacter americanus]|uniref:rhomboid family intramembrane serine protease n=1 Tax=Patulibacter americanus TaxID=588672 RepID=UPI0003B722D5|nr:rhomboid family intramembrane serine protease [Patulibacter americanus]
MAGAAELFTVCRSCGQQVSSFVTECPYCGTRLRQRAPRLDRKDGDLEALLRAPAAEPDRTLQPVDGEDDNVVPLKTRRRRPLSSRGTKRTTPRKPTTARTPKRGRLAGLGSDGRPWVTIAIVVLSMVSLPLQGFVSPLDLVLRDGVPAWHALTGALTYVTGTTWHALAVLTTFGVFGWLWERRAGALGALVVLVAFLVAGVGGVLADQALDANPASAGAAGAAVALATAWIVTEIRARARKESIDGDLAGAAVLLLVPVATTIITPTGAPVGLAIGVLLGGLMGLALDAARR